MTALRVLLTTDAVGGVWHYNLALAEALAPLGVETLLVAMGPPPSAAQRADAAALPATMLIETGLPLDWLETEAAPILAAGETVARLAEDHAVDLVQFNMPTLAAARAVSVPTIAVTHGCVASWWAAAKAEPLAREYRWHRALTGEGLQAADRVVAPTAAYAATIAKLYGLRQRPDVVHNGRRLAGPQRPGAPSDSVMTAGRLWDAVKGAALLDRVAARLTVPFHAAGAIEGPHGERASLDHLHCLGELEPGALAARLRSKPIFVSAATFEPFGLAVLEAAQAGCALVLSDIAGFRELWDGVAVFVAERDDTAWAAAIAELIGDNARRAALGVAARKRAARYVPEAMARAMAAIYREVLAAAPTTKVAA